MDTATQTQSLKPKATIFKVIPEEKQQLVEEKDADNKGKYFVNHSFSGFENQICVVISNESTVLVRSSYSFVAFEVNV